MFFKVGLKKNQTNSRMKNTATKFTVDCLNSRFEIGEGTITDIKNMKKLQEWRTEK